MFEYRLTAWPDLPSQFDRVGYRRALSDMSQRYVSVARLAQTSGVPRGELIRLIDLLEAKGAVARRPRDADTFFSALGRPGRWLESLLGIEGGWRPAPVASSAPRPAAADRRAPFDR